MHFGAIANTGQSHLQSACAIGKSLEQLGHRFTVFGTGFQVRRATELGVAAHQLGYDEPGVDLGSAILQNPNSFLGALLRSMKRMTTLLCEEAPPALKTHGIDFLLADQEEPGAGAAADLAGIPYITFCSSLPLNEDVMVPPSFVGWPASRNLQTRLKNYITYRVRNLIVGGVTETANRYRRRAGLTPYQKPDDSFSKLAHVSQLVKEFDFPRSKLPPNFHYVGPFQRGALAAVPFPFEKLNGLPLIYAALGTSQGVRTHILRYIAEACQEMPVQLIISLGGQELTEEHRQFPGSPTVVKYAPQGELLQRSALAIAHAGLNTTMEALGAGVPLISMPTNSGDQSGVAARIRHFGVGEVLDANKLEPSILRSAVEQVLNNSRYRASALQMKAAIDRTGGAAQAAAIIDALSQRLPPGYWDAGPPGPALWNQR